MIGRIKTWWGGLDEVQRFKVGLVVGAVFVLALVAVVLRTMGPAQAAGVIAVSGAAAKKAHTAAAKAKLAREKVEEVTRVVEQEQRVNDVKLQGKKLDELAKMGDKLIDKRRKEDR